MAPASNGSPNDEDLVDYDEYEPEEGVDGDLTKNAEEGPGEIMYGTDPTDFIRTEQKSIGDNKRDRTDSKTGDTSKNRDHGKRRREDSRDSRSRRRDNGRDRGDRSRQHRERSKDSRDRGKYRHNEKSSGKDRDGDRTHRDKNNRNDGKFRKESSADKNDNYQVSKAKSDIDKSQLSPPIEAPSQPSEPTGVVDANQWGGSTTNFGYGVKNMYYGNVNYSNANFQPYPSYGSKNTNQDGNSYVSNGEGNTAETPAIPYNQPPYPPNSPPGFGYGGYDPSGMYNNVQYGFPNYGYNFGQPPVPPGFPPSYGSQRNYNQPNYRKSKQQPTTPQLPEHERCTLLCTGIPTYVKEEDIRAHFESFGCVVELQLSAMENDTNKDAADNDGEKKKVYNECLVQFYSAQNAKKCFSSPLPVLNNRFIHLKFSRFNIMPPQDVEPPSMEELERDRFLLTQDIIPQTSASQPGGRKKPAFNMYKKGTSNKWRRTDDGSSVPVHEGQKEGSDENEVNTSNDNQEPQQVTTEQPQIAEGSEATDQPVSSTNEVVKKETSKEGMELKQSFDQLKSLKQQAEDILKRKEAVLQTQMEKCRQMMDQLEKAPNSDNKTSLLQNLEGKIVDLQAQLRTVREQIEKGLVTEKPSPPPKQSTNGGLFGGRFGNSPRFHRGGGRGFLFGRGKFGGRGFYGSEGHEPSYSQSADQNTTSEIISDYSIPQSNEN